MTSSVEAFLALLSRQGRGYENEKTGWVTLCPAHEDAKPSLRISQGDGCVLLACRAGCANERVVAEFGITLADLFDEPLGKQNGHAKNGHARVKAPDLAMEWDILDESGNYVATHVRRALPNAKKRYLWRRGNTWDLGGLSSEDLPLYACERVGDARTVVATEGEKACDALLRRGIVAVGTVTGAAACPGEKAIECLRGKTVLLWPDSDHPGKTHMIALAIALRGVAAEVRVVWWPDSPTGCDAADFTGDGAQLRALLDSSHPYPGPLAESSIERPQPVASSIATAQPVSSPSPRKAFPLDALPETVRRYVVEAAKTVGCCASAVAVALLVSLAAAIGNARRIRLKKGWSEPAVLWGAIIGESGTLKSPALDVGIAPMKRREARAARTHRELLERHADELQRHERDRAVWKAKGAGDPPRRPDQPALPRHLTSDPTIEKLAELLADNPRGMLLGRDELSAWLRSFDAYRAGGRGGDSAKWLEMYGAGLLLVDRKGGGTTRVPHAACSIVGTIQPDALRRALGVEHFEDGMAARFILTMPPATPQRWTEDELSSAATEGVERVLDGLFGLRPIVDEGGEVEPIEVGLAADTKDVWIEFVNEHAAQGEGLSGASAALWSKAKGWAARLALVVHSSRWAAGDLPVLALDDPIDVTSIRSGIALARWFVAEGERVYAVLRESADERERRKLVEWIDVRGGAVSVRDLARGPRRFRGDETRAEAALAELVKLGRGAWMPIPTTTKGGRPTQVFRLRHDGDGDTTPSAAPIKNARIPAIDGPESQNSAARSWEVSSPSPRSADAADDPADVDERAAIQGEGELFDARPDAREARRLRDEGRGR